MLAVNAGSNTISSFRVGPHGVSYADQIASGGVFPGSVTVHGGLVYVLNAASANIAGFRVDSKGNLSAISGSSRPLAGQAVPGLARQIGFDNTGRTLVVTLLGNPMAMPASGSHAIDLFLVGSDGTPSTAIADDATSPFPFGFAFDPSNRLITSQVTSLAGPPGNAASYRLSAGGALTPISTQATGKGFAPCWVAVTPNGKYAYVVDTGGGMPPGSTVAEFRIAGNGALTLIGENTQTASELVKTDDALSRDGHYLYVLVPAVTADATRIDVYKVAADGSLTLIGDTPATLARGASGLAAN